MENHEQASVLNGTMGLKLWGSLTSKLAGHPITSVPSLTGTSLPMTKIAIAKNCLA